LFAYFHCPVLEEAFVIGFTEKQNSDLEVPDTDPESSEF
jgi:hypothetical protein